MVGENSTELVHAAGWDYYDAGRRPWSRDLPCKALREGGWSPLTRMLYGSYFNDQTAAEVYCDMDKANDQGLTIFWLSHFYNNQGMCKRKSTNAVFV